MRVYRINVESTQGLYAQYSYDIDVYALDEEQAVERAFDRLKVGGFSDRSRSMWRIKRIEILSASSPKGWSKV